MSKTPKALQWNYSWNAGVEKSSCCPDAPVTLLILNGGWGGGGGLRCVPDTTDVSMAVLSGSGKIQGVSTRFCERDPTPFFKNVPLTFSPFVIISH